MFGKSSVYVFSAGCALLAITLLPAQAIAMDISETTTCKLVANEKILVSSPCTITGFAGQGVYEASIDYAGVNITLDENSDAMMNGQPLARYMRDGNFRKTGDPKRRKYLCYRAGQSDLCVKTLE